MTPRTLIVGTLAFAGGFIIMSLELLGGRVLAPSFGSDIYVWGSVITVFMLALSIGYLIGGRWSVRSPSLTRFGTIFVVAGIVLYPLVHAADPLSDWVFEHVEDIRYGSLLTAFGLFAPPTIVLGMIAPYAVRLSVRFAEESGQVAGTLYFVSTLGSALGTLATSFYLVLLFERDSIVIAMAAALLVLGGIAIFSDHRT